MRTTSQKKADKKYWSDPKVKKRNAEKYSRIKVAKEIHAELKKLADMNGISMSDQLKIFLMGSILEDCSKQMLEYLPSDIRTKIKGVVPNGFKPTGEK